MHVCTCEFAISLFFHPFIMRSVGSRGLIRPLEGCGKVLIKVLIIALCTQNVVVAIALHVQSGVVAFHYIGAQRKNSIKTRLIASFK